jgi:hypothetical protein
MDGCHLHGIFVPGSVLRKVMRGFDWNTPLGTVSGAFAFLFVHPQSYLEFRMRGSNMNLIALANCRTEPAHAQWISLNPHSEWMNFAHLCIMGRQRRLHQSKISWPCSTTWPPPEICGAWGFLLNYPLRSTASTAPESCRGIGHCQNLSKAAISALTRPSSGGPRCHRASQRGADRIFARAMHHNP